MIQAERVGAPGGALSKQRRLPQRRFGVLLRVAEKWVRKSGALEERGYQLEQVSRRIRWDAADASARHC